MNIGILEDEAEYGEGPEKALNGAGSPLFQGFQQVWKQWCMMSSYLFFHSNYTALLLVLAP